LRRLSFIAAAISATLLLTAASSSASQPRPALTVHVGSSIVVDGTHFHRHKRVKVTSSTGAAATVRTNADGAFTVRFRGVPADRCDALVVRAEESDGIFAMAHRPPPPDCAPMHTQGSPV
jgi:hypothetical protein